ncbi:MAG TPA: GAF and ANTAR domain-containing protein [Actinocrinis sp.]|uniref:GAF and ANTAR domain-containing protein n=1 Tax=Actinocrinis sp. TaxID=1920516 RepID=UPI002D525E2B|nr:GAF and ANTAR domain-containing protein [Actinocrinis sp.]HZU57328.1 GAF and ANTAR domain-containing protein [Actinocrinis sp.]
MGRDQKLSDAFVGLADTLGENFDVVDLFERLAAHCVALSGASAAGVMMSDGRGRLRVVAASQERAAFLDLFQLQIGKGPCVECYGTGEPVIAVPVATREEQWPELVPAVREAGFGAIAAVPLRLHENVIGAVNLFYAPPQPSTDEDVYLVQALADVAAMAMLRWPSPQTRPEDIIARLQATITNKVAIEQAKGALAQFGGIEIAEAGEALRAYAQARRTRITDVARAVVRRTLPLEEVLEYSTATPRRVVGESG